MRRPRVCMLLATDRLGGPGKGLVQFLRHGGLAGCSPVVVAYEAGEPGETEFTRAVRDTGADLRILRQRGAFDVSLIPQALRVVRDEGCEVLQSHGYKSHAVCACLHAMTGLPWVAFVHGWTAENVRVRAYRVLEQALLPLATRVVAVSDALGRSVWPAARRRMVVIPNAIDPAEALRDGDVPATGPHSGAHPDAFAQVPQVPGGPRSPKRATPAMLVPTGAQPLACMRAPMRARMRARMLTPLLTMTRAQRQARATCAPPSASPPTPSSPVSWGDSAPRRGTSISCGRWPVRGRPNHALWGCWLATAPVPTCCAAKRTCWALPMP